MIAFLKGKIINKGVDYIILFVKDIGYKIFVNKDFFSRIEINQSIELYIHQYVREDILSLYGFNTMEDLEMFEMLIGVSGIGPKSALSVSSVASATEIKEAIANGDPSLLIKVSGIGKKTAERVVLELRGKIVSLSGVKSSGRLASVGADEIDALVSLGYSLSQAREILCKVDPTIKDSGKRIKAALKLLG